MSPRMQPPRVIHGGKRLDLIAGAMLGFAMLLLIHRYRGIDHDAALYLGQGLAQRWPEVFSQDLFLAHAGQGTYTLVPWLLGTLLGGISAPSLFLWGGLAGLLLFATGSWYCLRALLPPAQRYVAWLGVLCLPAIYGRTIIFSYAEPFLTPRPVAEALCLLGIGLLARSRWMLATLCFGVAGIFHPLQTLAALLIVWPWAVLQDRRWLHAAWLAVPLALLAAGGVPPFDGLLRPLDADWLADLRAFNGQVFVTGWSNADYQILLFDVLLLAHGWRVLGGRIGTWCAAGLAGLVLGVGGSLLLVDGLHLVLPAGLQLWRVHWFAHWLAMAVLASVLVGAFQRGEWPRGLCLALAAVLVWTLGNWTWVAFGGLYWAWPRWRRHVPARRDTWLGVLFASGLLLLFAGFANTEWWSFKSAGQRFDLYPLDQRLLSYPLLALGLPLLGRHAWKISTRRLQWMLSGLLCLIIVVAALQWDARSPYRRSLEANAMRADLFGPTLPADAQVYWDRTSVVGTWLVLGRAEYFDPQQLSGVVFSRATAREARNRIRRMDLLRQNSRFCSRYPLVGPRREPCYIEADGIRQACAAGATPPPDYLILPYRQRQPSLGQWTTPNPTTGAPMTFWLYSCADLARTRLDPP